MKINVDGVTRDMTAGELQELEASRAAIAGAAAHPLLSRADFVVALTKTAPPILTEAEALAALESFPPKFAAALADKPLPYRAEAIEAWRTTTTVSRNAPLFIALLAFYATQVGLNSLQAVELGDNIFSQVFVDSGV